MRRKLCDKCGKPVKELCGIAGTRKSGHRACMIRLLIKEHDDNREQRNAS